MCGVTGFITKGTVSQVGVTDRRDYMRQTLIVDQLRGFHSTGVFYENNGVSKKPAGWAKECVNGTDFVNSKNYQEIENKLRDVRYMVGHNRWATTGASDELANAHPFQEGPVTLVHNGTLDGDGGLITPQLQLGVDVDSHAVCHNLASHSAEEVISAMCGAFTLIWADARDGSLNFVRNSERPLVMNLPTQDYGNTAYFGSERLMMEWIFKRNHIPQTASKFVDLPTGEIWSFFPGSLVPTIKKVALQPTYSYYYGRRRGGAPSAKKSQPKLLTGTPTKTTTVRGGTDKTKPRVIVHPASVPTCTNDLLNGEGFDSSDRLPFLPVERKGNMIVGIIEYLDVPCFLVGTTKASVDLAWERRWTIRPTGIRRVPNPKTRKSEVVLMAKLNSYTFHDSMWQWGGAWDESFPLDETADARDNLPKKAQEVQTDDVPLDKPPASSREVAPEKKPRGATLGIPHGQSCAQITHNSEEAVTLYATGVNKMGTASDWLESTVNGCVRCSTCPPLYTNGEVVWLDNGGFICGDCDKEMDQNG
jgi:hypothetical protein